MGLRGGWPTRTTTFDQLKETVAALEYAKELYQTLRPAPSRGSIRVNKAFQPGEISLTLNICDLLRCQNPPIRAEAIALDIQHALSDWSDRQTCEWGADVQHVHLQVFEISQRRKEYLRFMMEKEQYEPWQAACIGYVSIVAGLRTTPSGWRTRNTCSSGMW